MKTKLLILPFLILLACITSAQWTQKASITGGARAKSTSFTIGNKIYMMGGVNNSSITLRDFWEYDISSNTWTQKTNFPGPERYGAVSFVINGNGYIGTGGNDNGYLDDLWEYSPVSNNWIQKNGLPVTSAQHDNQRRESYAFVIGNKAYLGGGDGFVFGANSTTNIAFYDLWEYDAILNSWTQKADVPDFIGRDFSIGVSINGKGYVGLGCNVDETINRQSFWEYDPAIDSWTAKSDFPTLFTTDAGAFVLDSTLYVVGGVNLNPISLSNQFYKYDPSTDTWTQLSNFNGGSIGGEFAVSTGTEAFVGTGYNGSLIGRNDLWEFTSSTTGIFENNDLAGESVKIYPNPSSENIAVSSKKDISSVEVYDVNGNMLLKKENTFKNINILPLDAGVYNMKLILKDGSFYYKRFIKSN